MKKLLFYAVCKNGTVDVDVEGEGNYNYADMKYVKDDFPEGKYEYVEVKDEE